MTDDPRSINPRTERPYHDVQAELPEGWRYGAHGLDDTAPLLVADKRDMYDYSDDYDVVRISLGYRPHVFCRGDLPETIIALQALLREAKRRGWNVGEVDL